MVKEMQKAIRRYGNEMSLQHGGQTYSVRGFLQDTLSRSQENAQREFSPLGEICKGRYVYIGPVEPAAETGDVLTWQGREFVLRRAVCVAVNGLAAYCWGLCVEKGGDDAWES